MVQSARPARSTPPESVLALLIWCTCLAWEMTVSLCPGKQPRAGLPATPATPPKPVGCISEPGWGGLGSLAFRPMSRAGPSTCPAGLKGYPHARTLRLLGTQRCQYLPDRPLIHVPKAPLLARWQAVPSARVPLALEQSPPKSWSQQDSKETGKFLPSPYFPPSWKMTSASIPRPRWVTLMSIPPTHTHLCPSLSLHRGWGPQPTRPLPVHAPPVCIREKPMQVPLWSCSLTGKALHAALGEAQPRFHPGTAHPGPALSAPSAQARRPRPSCLERPLPPASAGQSAQFP